MRASTPAAEDADSALALLLSAARGAQACGYGAEDTERLVSELAAQLGMADVQVSSLPTQLQLAIGIPGQQRMVLLRTEPRPVDLDRIVRLDAVAREVKAGRIGPREASVRIDAIGRSPPPYPPPMVLFAYCLAAAGAVLLFGEDAPEAVTAAVAGLAVGAVAVVRSRVRELDLTAELVSAFLAGFICQTASARVWPLDPRVATLGAVVVLLPGFTLTQAVRELQTRNLLSGLSGLGATSVSFFALVIGGVLGGALGARLFGPARVPPVDELPAWLFLLGAAALGLAAVVVLRAPAREAPVGGGRGSALGGGERGGVAELRPGARGLRRGGGHRTGGAPQCAGPQAAGVAGHHPGGAGPRSGQRRLPEPARAGGPRRGHQHRDGSPDVPHRGGHRLRADDERRDRAPDRGAATAGTPAPRRGAARVETAAPDAGLTEGECRVSRPSGRAPCRTARRVRSR